ncbi:hypothetical protein ACFV3E_05985 [Streptomyces sp. NPDC059718]
MKHVANSSVQDAPGRTDLQEFPEGLPASSALADDAINLIRATLLEDTSSIQECRLAWILKDGPIDKLRNLEYSGLGLSQVWEMTSPLPGGTTPRGLVETIERGRSWDADGREKGSYRLAECGRLGYTSTTTNKTPNPQGPKDGWRTKDSKTHRVSDAPGYSEAVLLQPGHDMWTRGRLGGEGWRIAVLTYPVWEGSAKEWQDLAGGRDKAKRLTAKLEEAGVLQKTGKARATRYALDWVVDALILQEDPNLVDTRPSKLAYRHGWEHTRIHRSLTHEELEIRRRIQHAPLYAKHLLDLIAETEPGPYRDDLMKAANAILDAKEADWRRWFDAGRQITEDEVRELLPYELPDGELMSQQRAQMILENQRKTTEYMARYWEAKRAEMAAQEAEMAEPAVEEPREETEDDRLLRTLCAGNPRVFQAFYRRLPNQPIDPLIEARIAKQERRMARRKQRTSL